MEQGRTHRVRPPRAQRRLKFFPLVGSVFPVGCRYFPSGKDLRSFAKQNTDPIREKPFVTFVLLFVTFVTSFKTAEWLLIFFLSVFIDGFCVANTDPKVS